MKEKEKYVALCGCHRLHWSDRIRHLKKLKKSGFSVCGIDRVVGDVKSLDCFIEIDLNRLVVDESARCDVVSKVERWLGSSTLDVLVNNAAHQYISQDHPIPVDELMRSYNVNVIAPYLLVTNLSQFMTNETASVVNIGSIHSRLTKPGFLAYATTKAALAALTRGLALDFENRIRVNCIEPASVETPMLLAGLGTCPEKKLELHNYYPQKRIATPEEIAELVFVISSPEVGFLHGSCIDISGGISGRLHDPA